MVFSSLTFLFAYLPIVLAVYYITPLRWRNLVLFLVSLFFYGWGEPVYILLMILSILMNWIFGIGIEYYKKRDRKRSKRNLVLCIILNLSLLGFFKYWDFIATNLNAIGLSFMPVLNLSLPIGISFYTFQAMSYPIDLYRGDTEVQKSPVNFGAYVTMFPQLIAGPIVRYRDVAAQLKKRTETLDKFTNGITRFMTGLSKKVLLANSAGQVWEAVNALNPSETSVVTAWIGIACFTFQIYFDFSGYSDMAIGLGKMLGFDFLENFNYPYISKSITEFWRRWHMSLSYWFRDYVYIPLGGNRHGLKRQIINILIVWLLTGLWHGAAWNFILWGLLYGIVLIIEKTFLLKKLEKAPNWVCHVYTMIVVMIAWALFANTDITQAFHYIGMMFGGAASFINSATLFFLRDHFVLLTVCVIACTPFGKNLMHTIRESRFFWMIPVLTVVSFLICTAFIVDGTYNPFLYFRF